MNIAFPAVVIFLLAVPGLIYVTVLQWRGPSRSPPQPPAPFSIEAVIVVVASAAFHVIWLFAVQIFLYLFANYRAWPRAAIIFLAGRGGAADPQYDAAIDSVANYPLAVAFYFGGLYVFTAIIAWLTGPRLLPVLVQIGLLPDRQALANEWRQFFVSDEHTITVITTVVEVGGIAYLFVGKLVELYFNSTTQELDRFALEDVWRRNLSDDRRPRNQDERGPVEAENQPPAEELISDQWYSVEGNLFIIRYADAKTVNVRYWTDE